MISFWIFCLLYLVCLVRVASSITNSRSYSSRSFRHISSYQPYTNTGQGDWELGLRESVIQALIREHYHDPNIRKHIQNAPILGKQDRATPFGDIAIIARGQLFIKNNAYVFVQDKYENDCDDCHTIKNRCGHLQCDVWVPKNGEQLIALWTVKRIRHRSYNQTPNYEIEYTISPINHVLHHGIVSRNGRFNYAVPGHVFVIREETTNNVNDFYENPHHHRHKIVIGEGPNGYRNVLQSYPGFLSNHEQTTENRDIYHQLINALNKKTTKEPEQTKSSTRTSTVVTALPKSTLVQFPTGEIIPIDSLTSPYLSKTTSGYVSVRFPETTTYLPPTTTKTPVKTTFHFFSASEDEIEPPQKTTQPVVTQPQKTTYILPEITHGGFTESYSTQPMRYSVQYTSESLNNEVKTTQLQSTKQPTTKYTSTSVPTTVKQPTTKYTSTSVPTTVKQPTTKYTSTSFTTTLKPSTKQPTTRYTSTSISTTLTPFIWQPTKKYTTLEPTRTTKKFKTTKIFSTTSQFPGTTKLSKKPTQFLTETTNVLPTTKPTTIKEFAVTGNSKTTTPKLISTTINADGTVIIETTPILTSTKLSTDKTTTTDNAGLESNILTSKTTLSERKTTLQNTVTPTNQVEMTKLKITRLKPVVSTTPNTFLTGEIIESKEPQYTKPVLKDVSNDDIFGGPKQTTKSVKTTTKKYVVSDIEKDLFGENKPKNLKTATKVIYSDFFEASTTEGLSTTTVKIQPVTKQSYSTSISFEVNKRNRTTLVPEITTESSTIINERMDTKEVFDDAALRLINHARTIDILNNNNTTIKPMAKRRRKYVARIKRPARKSKEQKEKQ